ncbi:glycosyl hydrolase family 28-related protein [Methylocella sp.]|uniref:glycosyl hydrolase family 28-related protein n=1 Tax=Methylocella sp. TaxID=1978226 RepID=UPI0037850915
MNLRRLIFACGAAAVATFSSAAAAPAILTSPVSGNPGDFITLSGSGFGSAPRVFLKSGASGPEVELDVSQSRDNLVVVRIPRAAAFDLYTVRVLDTQGGASASTQINAPQVHYIDAPDTASGYENRVFGRNLYVNGQTPVVSFLDTVTNAKAQATVVGKNPYQLIFVAPSSIVAGHPYKVVVSNAYAETTSESTTMGHPGGHDFYKTNMAWGAEFTAYDLPSYRNGAPGGDPTGHRYFNVKTDPALVVKATGDGVTNDAPAIQAAIDKASKNGGGRVFLPAGVYNLGYTGIYIRAGVAIQGAGRTATKIIYGPTTPQGSSFTMAGVYIPDSGARTGIADLSIQNLDVTSQRVRNLNRVGGTLSKFFIVRVDWDMGSGWFMDIIGDRIVILGSTFTQAKNYHNGDQFTGGLGPFYIKPVTNMTFKDNIVTWATNQIQIDESVNVRIESNRFIRSASDTIVATAAQTSWPYTTKKIEVGDVISRRIGRHLAMQFCKNIFVTNNSFEVSDGRLADNWNDGEGFLNESRGREDVGVVTAASATSVTDDSRCSGDCVWNYYPNASVIFLVSGDGAGQWRRITGKNGNTFMLDRPWDVTPKAGDHFSMAPPSFENVVVYGNFMTGPLTGVALWSGMFINVSVVGNRLTDASGIYIDAKSWDKGRVSNFRVHSAFKNIEIKANILKNTLGQRAVYIWSGQTLVYPNQIWGTSMFGVEIRSNQLTAKPGTYPYLYREGYNNNVLYQSSAPYVESGIPALLGVVFQGNSCVNCPRVFTLTTGAVGTVLWNTSWSASPGVSSIFLYDVPVAPTTTQASSGTVVGKD